ncbi:MAG: NUMOD3 domain-containing DNA-binding protein [Candidatus Paceibacterota bacterium]
MAKERHKNGIYIGKCMTGKHHSEETKEKLRQIAFSIRKLNHDCSGEMFS